SGTCRGLRAQTGSAVPSAGIAVSTPTSFFAGAADSAREFVCGGQRHATLPSSLPASCRRGRRPAACRANDRGAGLSHTSRADHPIRDFTPVILAVASPHVLLVNPSFPAKNVKELVALVKANPGKYSYASAGTGQSAQLAAELFKLAFGLDIVHVPFNGGAPAVNSTMGGHTQMAFNALPSAAALIKEGKLRPLAVTSGERPPEFPDVPTLAEAGAPGQESLFFQGIVAPAGTPKDIVDQLYREIEKILARPEVKDRLAAIGFGVTIS